MSRTEKMRVLEEYIGNHAAAALVDRHELGLDARTLAMRVSGGLAFLCVVRHDELHASWYQLQKQMAHVRDEGLAGFKEPDLYLVLLTDGQLNRLDLNVQAIMRDPYVCRKLVLEWGDRHVEEVMAETPFWALELPPNVGEVPPVTETMAGLGFNPDAIEALLTTGPDRLVQRLLSEPGTSPLTLRNLEGQQGIPVRRSLNGKVHAADKSVGAGAANRWRIREITLDGFRAYKKAQKIDLAANLVVIYAPNGTGKTSLCEGIEWAMTGSAHRIVKPGHDAPNDAEPPVRHVERKGAKVAVTLEMGRKTKVIEHYDGEDGSYWTVGGNAGSQRDLITQALEAEVPPQRSVSWIREAFLRYHYLEQGTSFEFLSKSNPKDRYKVFELMMGGAEYALVREKLTAVVDVLGRRVTAVDADATMAAENLALWRAEQKRLAQLTADVLTEIAGHDVATVAAQAWQAAIDLGLIAGDVQAPDGERALAELIDQQAGHRLLAADEAMRTLRSLPPVAHRSGISDKLIQLGLDLEILASQRAEMTEHRSQTQEWVLQAAEQKGELEHKVTADGAQFVYLARVLELQPLLVESGKALSRAAEQERATTQRLAAKRAELTPKRDLLQNRQEELAGWQQRLEAYDRRDKDLQVARVALSAWLEASEGAHNARTELRDVVARQFQLSGQIRGGETEAANLRQTYVELTRQADNLRAVLSERHRLVAALQAHIDGSDCPLCGTPFHEPQMLIRAVEASLHAVPPALADLEQQLKGATESLDDVLSRVAIWQTEATAFESRRAELTKKGDELADQQISNATIVQRHVGDIALGPQTGAVITQLMSELEAKVRTAQTESGALARDLQDLSGVVTMLSTEEAQLNAEVAEASAGHIKAQQSLRTLEAEHAQIPAAVPAGETVEQALARVTADRDASRRNLEQLAINLKTRQEELAGLDHRRTALSGLEQQLERERGDLRSELSQLQHDLQTVGLPIDAQDNDVNVRTRQVEATSERLRTLGGMVVVLRAAAALKESLSSQSHAQTKAIENADSLRGHHEHRVQIGLLRDQCLELDDQLKGEAGRLIKAREGLFEPTISEIYHRLNAHPYFNDVRLAIDEKAEEFRVQVVHPKTNQPVGGVAQYYSMAQINIVTLSIFLAQAMLQGWSRLSTIILDDPVQHLDDMNTYALLDLIQIISKMGRQLIITTSDRQIYKLMLIKFSALNQGRQTGFKAYRLRGLGDRGPIVVNDTDLVSVE